MKKLSLSLILFCLVAYVSMGADLLVEEFGVNPSYSSISSAVAAASDGDRIIIKNRSGGLPWQENITVNKSLEFLSYTNDDFFIVQGNWNMVPSSGRVITMVGMKNNNGNITGSAGSGSRTVINIFDSELSSGHIYLSYGGLDVNVVGTKLTNGVVQIRYGNIVGCDLRYTGNGPCIYVTNDGTYDNRVINIVGNRVTQTTNTTNSQFECIEWNSSYQFFNIRNNFIYTTNTGIALSNVKNSNAVNQYLVNNSIQIVNGVNSSGSVRTGILLDYTASSSVVEVLNNIIDCAATYTSPDYTAIKSNVTSGTRNLYYNMIDNNGVLDTKISGSWSINSNNYTATSITMDSNTGAPSSGIDMGLPATIFYDIDLTPNDLGCYGGSFTMDNFFPIHTGSARVWYVSYPFNVLQGSTVDVTGATFDR